MSQKVLSEIIALANKLQHITCCYTAIVINGSRFQTKGEEMNWRCKNSGGGNCSNHRIYDDRDLITVEKIIFEC